MSASARRPAHVLLGVCGAIAAYRAADVLRGLRRAGAEVTPALTENAVHFVTPFLLSNLAGRPAVVGQYGPEMADVHHVQLAFEVDLLLVAPATADVLARMAAGIAGDFLTTFYLATAAPTLVAPAMNTRMWEHPATQTNVRTLRERGVRFVGPVSGELATLHSGMGRMADAEDIVAAALGLVAADGPLGAEVVLVTAGPTAEDLDLARSITNRSTGKMGYAIALEALRRGAEVILISGPTELSAPAGVELVRVRSAAEMKVRIDEVLERVTVVIMAAAVSDFRPEHCEPRKIKKTEQGERVTLTLVRTEDILAGIGRRKGGRILIGFAAEDGDLEANARDKLDRKGLDLVVANDISHADRGFAAEENEVIILGADGTREDVSLRPKAEVARRILDHLEVLVERRGKV